MVSTVAIQFPFPVEVSINMTLPFDISFALAVYDMVKLVLEGLKVPDPVVVQTPPLATVIEPDTLMVGFVPQIDRLGPAFAVGAGV